MGVTMAGESIDDRLARGVAHEIQGEYDEAIEELKAILEEDSSHAGAHMHLGLIYGFIGLFDESIQELRTAVHLAPMDLVVRNNLAKTYAMLGCIDEAREQFTFVLEQDPTNEEALKNLTYL